MDLASAPYNGRNVPGRGRTGTALRPRDFRTTTAFAASQGCSWSGLCLDPDDLVGGPPPSSLCTFPEFSGLRSALPRALLAPGTGVPLNLTGFTPVLSPPGAQFALSPLRLPVPPRAPRAHFRTSGSATPLDRGQGPLRCAEEAIDPGQVLLNSGSNAGCRGLAPPGHKSH